MKLRVPLYGSANKIVWVDDEATKGAIAGSNLFLSDGKTLVTDDMLTGGSSGRTSATLTTTDDLNEGKYRLYFTSRRAQDAVGGILDDSANITLRYGAGASITADLTDATVTSGGTLKKRAFDAKGRLSQESSATTDDLSEGATNLYFTSARVLATTLTGLSTSTATAVTASDSVLVGIGKLQAQASANATAIAGKEPAIASGTTSQYWRGDKTWRDFATDVRSAVLTGLSTATSAVISATDTVLGALGKLQAQITDNLLPAGYIDGLQMQWVSGTALTVSSGAAYIQGSGKVLRATSAIAKTGLSLTASTWYHVYLYSNAGTPDIEISTTAPAAAYNGTARSKTGDTSRRYVGSVLTDASAFLSYFVPHSRWGWSDFYAAISVQQNISQGVFVVVQYNSLARDVAGEWNASTWTFTASQRGLYLVSGFAHPEKLNDGLPLALSIFVNGAEAYRLGEQSPRSASNNIGAQVGSSCVMPLNAGDAVTFRVYCGGSQVGAFIDAIPSLSYASIYRLQ